MITDAQALEAAHSLLSAEDSGDYRPPLTDTFADLAIDDAYRISQHVTALKTARGATIRGYKIGLTSAAMREMTGATEPDFGALFDYWFIDSGARVSRAAMNRPAVEIELALVVGRDVRGPGVTAAEIVSATECVYPAIEIVDSRFTTTGGPRHVVVNSVADAASCGAVILGDRAAAIGEVELDRVQGELIVNGQVVESGSSAAVMGGPAGSAAWLVNKLSEFDTGLHAGQVILSGSFIRAAYIAAGDSVSASLGSLGRVALEVVA